MNTSRLIPLAIATCVVTAFYFWFLERDTYRCSWRIHVFGIALPIILMYVSRNPFVWIIASGFLATHVTSIISERHLFYV